MSEQDTGPALDLDLDAKLAQLAQEAEATRTTTTVTLNGRQIELKLIRHWPMKARHLMFDEANAYDAWPLLLEDKDLEAVLRLEDTGWGAILDHLIALHGVTPGEADGSATSSRSTRTRSKRTSESSPESESESSTAAS